MRFNRDVAKTKLRVKILSLGTVRSMLILSQFSETKLLQLVVTTSATSESAIRSFYYDAFDAS